MPFGTAYSIANQLVLAATPGGDIWMVDGGQGYSTQNTACTLWRINGSDPTHPTVAATVDLTPYGGAARVVKADGNYVFVGLFPPDALLGNRPGSAQVATPFVVIDITTNTIVGAATVSSGLENMRVRDFAFDGYGTVFVNATNTQSGLMNIWKYQVSEIIAAFPTIYSNPLAIFPPPIQTICPSGTGLPTGTIYVNSTAGFEPYSGKLIVQTNFGDTFVTYGSTSPGTFNGCVGGSGSIPDNGIVQQTGFEHYETMTYGGGYLWCSTGLYSNLSGGQYPFNVSGRLIRIHPDTGQHTSYNIGGVYDTGSAYLWGCLYAFGSVWATGADTSQTRHQLYRFDPNTFPNNPTVIELDAGNTISNTCELAADNSTIWVTNGSSFNGGYHRLFRVSTTPGSEALIATVNVPGTTGSTQSAVFDGTTLWSTVRYAPNPANVGLVSVSTGLGTESFINMFNPSLPTGFFEPMSVTVTGQANQTPTFEDPRRQLPIWGSAAGIFWDGAHLWVGDGDTSGILFTPENINIYSNQTMDPRVRFVRILDVRTNPAKPYLVGSIDLWQFGKAQNVVSIKGSNDGNYVYICVRVTNQFPGEAGRVLIVDKRNFQVVGNCQMTVGNIGTPGNPSTGARDCAEDQYGQLWVTNSNTFQQNIIEVFNISNALAYGTTPTYSAATVQCPDHAEELAWDGTYIWTTGWNWTSTVQRLDPAHNTISSCTDPQGRFLQGCSFLLGQLWAIDENGKVLRLNRAAFVSGGTANMVGDSLTLPVPGNFYSRNTFTSDGTNLWVGNSKTQNGLGQVFKVSPTPGSVNVLSTVQIQFPGDVTDTDWGTYKLTYDGKYLWGSVRSKNGANGGGIDRNSTIIKIDPVGGQQLFQWSGPTRSIWMGNKTQPVVARIDTSNPTNPKTIAQVDLSAYGSGIKSVRTYRKNFWDNNVFVGLFPFAGQPGAGSSDGLNDAPFVIIDASVNQIVGVANVSTGGDIGRAVDFAFDEDQYGRHLGHVYALVQDNHFAVTGTFIYKYLWQDIINAYPSVYATPTAKFHISGVHLENLTFGAGYLWGVTGDYNNPGIIYRIDPSTGSTATYTAPSGAYFNIYYAFGSLWVTGADSPNDNKVYRFNPSTFPSGPIAAVNVDPSDTHANTCSMVADATTLWVSNGSNFVTHLPILYRISTGLGTEALMANPTIAGITGTTQGVAWDGENIWASIRFGATNTNGLASFSTGIGSEAFIAKMNPGNAFSDPVAIDCD